MTPQHWTRGSVRLGVIAAFAACSIVVGGARAHAGVGDSIGLGTADNFAVLAGQGITNTGPTTVDGDIGTSPNPAVVGAGLTVNGTIHAADAVAAQAQSDLTVAYGDAAGRPADEIATELGGNVLQAGVYDSASGTFGITGALTLDAGGDPDAVFVFQAASTLITASGSTVSVINGGDACNVFWQVGSSATLGSGSTFVGSILALTSITVMSDVTLEGRALARNGAVTLDSDTIARSVCATPETTGTTVESSDDTTDAGEPVTFTATVTGDGGGAPTGTVTFLENGTPIGSSPLDGGLATLTTAALADGPHTITATYLGAPGFESSTSQDLTQLVVAPPQAPSSPTTPPPSTTTVGTEVAPPTGPRLPRTGGPGASTAGAALGLLFVAGGVLLVRHAAGRRTGIG